MVIDKSILSCVKKPFSFFFFTWFAIEYMDYAKQWLDVNLQRP